MTDVMTPEERSRIMVACARNIPDRTSISECPARVDGKRSGDWEVGLIIGRNGYPTIYPKRC